MVMVARKRYRWAAWSFAVSDVMRALAMVALAVTLRRLDWLLVGAIACAAVRLGVALLYFQAEFPRALRPRAALFREQLVYVLPFAVAVVIDLLQANFHSYAVSHRFDPATFAVYAVGCFQIPLLELVASPMCNVMMVRMSESLRDGRGGEAAPIWTGTTRVLALLFLPAAAVLAVCAPDLIVFLFTERYGASVPIFMIWSLSIALSAFQTDGVLRVYAATRFLLALSAVRLVLTAALIGPALAQFGLRGAVIVTVGVAAVSKAAALARIAGLLQVRFALLLPWRDLAAISGIAAAAAAPAFLLRSALQVPPFAGLAITGLVYAGAYTVLLFASGVLRDHEKRALAGWLQRWPAAAPAAGIGG
jgi:O-antigen/teichoic acid export membrane protein